MLLPPGRTPAFRMRSLHLKVDAYHLGNVRPHAQRLALEGAEAVCRDGEIIGLFRRGQLDLEFTRRPRLDLPLKTLAPDGDDGAPDPGVIRIEHHPCDPATPLWWCTW